MRDQKNKSKSSRDRGRGYSGDRRRAYCDRFTSGENRVVFASPDCRVEGVRMRSPRENEIAAVPWGLMREPRRREILVSAEKRRHIRRARVN